MAEVRSVFSGGDGAAELHTRSLRYGKLRNGMLLVVKGGGTRGGSGGGGGSGVGSGSSSLGTSTGRRQTFTLSPAPSLPSDSSGTSGPPPSDIDVILGLNGYIWIAAHVDDAVTAKAAASLTNVNTLSSADELTSQKSYSSQNDEPISASTRIEIARLALCIKALVAGGVRIEEGTVLRAYEVAIDLLFEEKKLDMEAEGEEYEDENIAIGLEADGLGEDEDRKWQRKIIDGVYA